MTTYEYVSLLSGCYYPAMTANERKRERIFRYGHISFEADSSWATENNRRVYNFSTGTGEYLPSSLHQVFFTFFLQYFQVHENHLVWMLDVDAEAELFQQTSFRFDHFVLSIDVHLIDHQGPNEAAGSDLFDMMKDVDHIANPSGVLFDFACEIRTGHGYDFHLTPNERGRVEVSMEEHLARGDRCLW